MPQRWFENAGFPRIADPPSIDLWRFSYLAERKLISRLRHLVKCSPELEGPREALKYHDLVNHQIFFVKDVRERLSVLYDAYNNHPRLSLGIAREKDGHPFDPHAYGTSTALREAIYEGKHPRLQASLYIEHRARLAILKAAIDYICLSEAGLLSTLTGDIDWNQILFNTLPTTFHKGLNQLERQPSFRRYALFLQVFLWGLGGFYLEDRKETEFRWLSERTGIPYDEIPAALKVFDVLFPRPGGESWIVRPGPTQCNVVMMVPTPFKGLGAYERIRIHGLMRSYEELGYTDYTSRDLGTWTLSAIHFLRS
jgi:hypothetical protein